MLRWPWPFLPLSIVRMPRKLVLKTPEDAYESEPVWGFVSRLKLDFLVTIGKK